MSSIIRSLVREIITESAKSFAPSKYTPAEIMRFEAKMILMGVDKFDNSYYFGNFIVNNFYPATSEDEVIIELLGSSVKSYSQAVSLGGKPVPVSYTQNLNSKFIEVLKNKFPSSEAQERLILVAKNVTNDQSLEDSKTYNSSKRFFIITSSTNPNFKYVSGEDKPSLSAEVGKLFKEVIANPLEGYGIYVTSLPKAAQDESIRTLSALQTILSGLSVVPGYGKFAGVANLGPSLALASIYKVQGKNIDPNSKVELPVVDIEVSGKSLNNFIVGANVVGGILGCFGGLHQAIAEVEKLRQIRSLSGISSIAGTGLNTFNEFKEAYTALGKSVTLAASYTDDAGNIVNTSVAGWRPVSGGFIYVTGPGSGWINKLFTPGIIASSAGDVVVFTQGEVSFITSLITNGNYGIILLQLQNVVSGAGRVMSYVGFSLDTTGFVLDLMTLKDLLKEFTKEPPPKDALPIPDPTEERRALMAKVSEIFEQIKKNFSVVQQGKSDWSKYYSKQGFVTIMNMTTGERKSINQLILSGQNILNSNPKVTYTPQLVVVSDSIYKTFEIIMKLPSSFNPPKNYFWKCNNDGSVIMIISSDLL